MAGILDSAEVDIPCEKCGGKTKKSIGWIKRNSEFTCVCGQRITLNADQFRREIGKVDRSVDALKGQIKKMNK